MPAGSRAIIARQKQIAELVQERQEAWKRNSSLKLHTKPSLAKAIGWSVGTVREDIRALQADGHPLVFDTKLNGYLYTEKFAGVPTTFVTESDLAKLCLAIRSFEALKGTPVYKPIRKALDMMTRSLTDKFGIDVEALKSTVTFRSTGVDALTDPAVIETLMHAINRHEELEVVYSKLNASEEAISCSNGSLSRSSEPSPPTVLRPPSTALPPPPPVPCPYSALGPQPSTPTPPTSDLRLPTSAPSPSTVHGPQSTEEIPHPTAPWLQLPLETRKVHPLHILCQDNAWYLWLWDPVRKDKRRFSLSRIRSITRTGKTFRPRKFDIHQEIEDSFGVTSGKAVDVKIQFRRKASYLVAERPWHHSQQLAPGPDSEWNLELTMNVALTPELIRWLMGYDQDFRVIEPASLDEAISRKLEGMLALRRSQSTPV